MLNIWYRGLPVVECVFTSSPFIENVCASSLCIQRSWSMCLSQRCQKGMKRRKKLAKMFNFILDVLRHTIFTSKTYTHTLQRGSKLYRTRTTIFFAVSFIISCTYVRCICYESTKLCDRYTTMCSLAAVFQSCAHFFGMLGFFFVALGSSQNCCCSLCGARKVWMKRYRGTFQRQHQNRSIGKIKRRIFLTKSKWNENYILCEVRVSQHFANTMAACARKIFLKETNFTLFIRW